MPLMQLPMPWSRRPNLSAAATGSLVFGMPEELSVVELFSAGSVKDGRCMCNFVLKFVKHIANTACTDVVCSICMVGQLFLWL